MARLNSVEQWILQDVVAGPHATQAERDEFKDRVRADPRGYIAQPEGAGYKAEIVNILEGSKDRWFRPSDVCVAPDGSLIIADWYDPGVGGHNMGDNIPEEIRGRIYRVVHESRRRDVKPSLSAVGSAAA